MVHFDWAEILKVCPAGSSDSHDLALLAEALFEAAPVALSYFRRRTKTWMKPGNTLVGEADLAVDCFLKEYLLSRRPNYGWLSEEDQTSHGRVERSRNFVVDPIDGTNAFLSGNDEWVMSVAVVEKHRPVAAALMRPAAEFDVGGNILLSCQGCTAFSFKLCEQKGALLGNQIKVSDSATVKGSRVSLPRKWYRLDEVQDFLRRYGLTTSRYIPSLALRLVSVSQGETEFVISSGEFCDWDIVAADLLIRESGGRLATMDGKDICYDTNFPSSESLIVAPLGLLDEALSIFQDLESMVRARKSIYR